MSKSYGNAIELWGTEKQLKKSINKIATDSSAPEDPKDPNNCVIMDLYKLFATPDQIKDLERRYKEGIGWGFAKLELFNVANEALKAPREKFNYLMQNRSEIDAILAKGAVKAQSKAKEVLSRVKKNITGF
jgi:tryptophanyl-tRNA synthetase